MAYTGEPINVTGGSLKLATVELAKAGTLSATVNTETVTRERKVWGNHPNSQTIVEEITLSGDVSYINDKVSDPIQPSDSIIAMVIEVPGLIITANVKILTAATTLDVETNDAVSSFTFKSADQAFTLVADTP